MKDQADKIIATATPPSTPTPNEPTPPDSLEAFRKELTAAINRYSMENKSSTPDWILADFIVDCLLAHAAVTRARDKWYGHKTLS